MDRSSSAIIADSGGKLGQAAITTSSGSTWALLVAAKPVSPADPSHRGKEKPLRERCPQMFDPLTRRLLTGVSSTSDPRRAAEPDWLSRSQTKPGAGRSINVCSRCHLMLTACTGQADHQGLIREQRLFTVETAGLFFKGASCSLFDPVNSQIPEFWISEISAHTQSAIVLL